MSKTINIQSFLEKYYWENDSVILACSGWPDSMYLLYQVLWTTFGKNLVVCYFNHKTRIQTDEEERYIVEMWKERWFKVEVAECDFEKIQKLYPSKSFEELAREKRYQFFDAVMNIHNSKYVITGHHLDDRIETFFFNMLRGTKLTGLINMRKAPPQSPSIEGEVSGWILRPLLDLEKLEILEYLHWNNLRYFIDETNSDTNITRNKMRHEILPKLWEIHPDHKKNIANLLTYFEEVKVHLDTQVNDFLRENSCFSLNQFQKLSPLMQKEIIREIYYKSNWNSTIWLSEGNISEVIRFINGPNGNTVKEIKKMKLHKKSSKIFF